MTGNLPLTVCGQKGVQDYSYSENPFSAIVGRFGKGCVSFQLKRRTRIYGIYGLFWGK